MLQGTADRAAKLSLLDAGGKVVRDLLPTGSFIVEEHAKRNKRLRPWKEEERRNRARKCSRRGQFGRCGPCSTACRPPSRPRGAWSC